LVHELDSNREVFLDIIESEKKINNRFTRIKRIDENGGGGYFSLLFKAHDLQTKNPVALKFFDPTKYFELERVKRFLREAEMLRKFKSEPYVLNIIDGPCELTRRIIDEQTGKQIPIPFRFISTEWAGLSIEDFIYSRNSDAMLKLTVFKEMIKAITRIHRLKVCHRDVKPSNVLMVGNDIRISDFGTAKCMDGNEPDISQGYAEPVGDQNYCAPETFFSIGIADEHVFLADIFSMGAILFEMFTQTLLTNEIYNRTVFSKIYLAKQILSPMTKKNRFHTYKGISNDLTKLIQLPDIHSYNDNVPNCIRNHLNNLYKSLSAINFLNRLKSSNSIHRQIDICILILKNENKYLDHLEIKRKRRLQRIKKELRRRKISESLQC